MTIYIYDADTSDVIAAITGNTNEECEKYVNDNYNTNDEIRATYSPGFGFANGLNNNEHEIINLAQNN